jgi:excinuclease ABC subunit C
MTPQDLRTVVRAGARNLPGVYRMRGTRGEVIYVGKSKRVRTRLLSYFRAPRGSKGARIIEEARGIDWSYEPSEFAALLAELRQIRSAQPRLNRQLRRADAHLFLRITPEAAPRLVLVPVVPPGEAGRSFGPFRGRRRLRRLVRELSDLFQLRDCAATTPIRFADQGDLFGHRPPHRCPRPELGTCLAPCAAACTEAGYGERVDRLAAFLRGDDVRPMDPLRTEMARAAADLRFEYALRLRDRLAILDGLLEEIGARQAELATLSFLYAAPVADGDRRLYLIHHGVVRGETSTRSRRGLRRIRLDAVALAARGERPPILTGEEMQEALIVRRWFRTHAEEAAWTVPIAAAAAGERPPRRRP